MPRVAVLRAAVPRAASGCRAVLAAAAALCAVAALPGVAAADDGVSNPYDYQPGWRPVEGGGSIDAAGQIAPSGVYKSTIGPEGGSQGQRYYRVELDGKDNVYLSVTAVPRLRTTVSSADGIEVTLRDGDGYTCSTDEAHFGPAESPRPLSAVATRMMRPTGGCQRAGTYYLLVERNTDALSSLDEWGLEINVVTEPGLGADEPSTPLGTWDSTSPQPPAGEPRERHGRSSFGTARGLEEGAWRDRIEPGETLFYRVPVGWGQQLSARAHLTGPASGSDGAGGTGGSGADFVSAALVLALYNPVRAFVEEGDTSYQGQPAATTLRPLPPVAYRNRHGGTPQSAMRLGGSYYLAVTLNPRVADEFGRGAYGVVLDVGVRGTARPSPDYLGRPEPAGAFLVTPRDQRNVEPDAAPHAPARNGAMQLLGVAALGTGTLLVLVLAVWTLLARRHGPAAAAPTGGQDPIGTWAGHTGAGHTGAGSAEPGRSDFGGVRYGDGTDHGRAGYGGDEGHDGGVGPTGATERAGEPGHSGSGAHRAPGGWRP